MHPNNCWLFIISTVGISTAMMCLIGQPWLAVAVILSTAIYGAFGQPADFRDKWLKDWARKSDPNPIPLPTGSAELLKVAECHICADVTFTICALCEHLPADEDDYAVCEVCGPCLERIFIEKQDSSHT
jgi:hypothetical protein